MRKNKNLLESLTAFEDAPLTLKKMKQTKNTIPNYSSFKKMFEVKQYNSKEVRLVQFYKPISKL